MVAQLHAEHSGDSSMDGMSASLSLLTVSSSSSPS